MVKADLAGMSDGVPERFVPEEMRGELIEAEHLGRYAWAASLGRGRRVLDAGCGMAYGSAMLAEADAEEVVGVDRAEPVLEAARERVGSSVRLEQADLNALPFEDGEFGLVACFEVIEHIEEPLAVLDELRRVLAPDGLLAISSPNRRRSQGNNPHHLHEFEPEELERELRARWDAVRMLRQHDVVGALIYDPSDTGPGPFELEARSTAELGEEEVYTIALCGPEPLPPSSPSIVLTGLFVLDRWIRYIEAQDDALNAQAYELNRWRSRLDQLPTLRARLSDAETVLTEVRQDRDRLLELATRTQYAEAQLEAVRASRSWRLTAPLRGRRGLARRAADRQPGREHDQGS